MRLHKLVPPAVAALCVGVNAGPPRECPPLGPVLPAPRNPSAHPLVQATVQAIQAALPLQLGILNHSAVSLGIRSVNEDGPPLLDFHYTPPDQEGGKQVTSETVYRIGSVTKVFAILAALQLAEQGVLRMDDPVGKWVKELAGGDWDEEDALDAVNWEEVTVASVASHISGIGADIFLDFAAFPGHWEDLGLPKLPDDANKPACSGFGGTTPCTRKDLTEAFTKHRDPIYPPFGPPVYSNVGSTIVGLVVEEASGKAFEDVIRSSIYEPAGMTKTTMSTPVDNDDLFIPTNGTAWEVDIGVFGPAGSMNSNTKDLLSFAMAIMKNKLLSPTGTRKWFKPSTFTAGWAATVGAPFENYRLDNLTPDGRIIDIFTKGGDIIDYHSMVAMVPEFGFAVSVLAAGPEASSMLPSMLLSGLLRPLVPAINQAARDEAQQRFAGTYVDEKSNSTLEISMDQGPGLVLTDWIMRGYEVLPNLDRYDVLDPNKTEIKPRFSSARLYPTGLETKRRAAWRAALPAIDDEQAELMDKAVIWKDAHCIQWLSLDRKTFNYKSLDQFEFIFGEDGWEATGIKVKGFDVELVKVATKGESPPVEDTASATPEDIIADEQVPLKMETVDEQDL